MVQTGNSLQKKTKDDVESALLKQHDGDVSPNNDQGLRYELSVWTLINCVLSILALVCVIVVILLCRHGIEDDVVAIFWILAMQLGTALFCLVIALRNTYGCAGCFRSKHIRIAACGAILVSIAGIIGFVQLTVMKTVDPQSCRYFPRILMLIQSAISIVLYTLGFGLIYLCT